MNLFPGDSFHELGDFPSQETESLLLFELLGIKISKKGSRGRLTMEARKLRGMALLALVGLFAPLVSSGGERGIPVQSGVSGLTAVEGLKVGHSTLEERPTGCTVVLAEAGAVAGVDVRGSSPGTRETDLLDPINMVQKVHAVVLSGGSAFGLDTASGVVRLLEERGVGFDVRIAKIPIVPAAILFDLGVGGKPGVRPGAECGYKAASAASSGPVEEGSVGAGAGATVGKALGGERAMKSGVGTASIRLANGLVVGALVAVNAWGDVIHPETGKIVAGVRSEDGKGFADARKLIRSGARLQGLAGRNTTIGVVATNGRLDKAQATKMAQMAHDGVARAVQPAHTPFDGDTIFALATGAWDGQPDLLTIGELAAQAMADAIVRAVEAAESVAGFPAARDINRR
jgi:L-aminopeptidase/D-esterase-like protein